jgi:hypothetical protein
MPTFRASLELIRRLISEAVSFNGRGPSSNSSIDDKLISRYFHHPLQVPTFRKNTRLAVYSSLCIVKILRVSAFRELAISQ